MGMDSYYVTIWVRLRHGIRQGCIYEAYGGEQYHCYSGESLGVSNILAEYRSCIRAYLKLFKPVAGH